jgi:hypothetical protein
LRELGYLLEGLGVSLHCNDLRVQAPAYFRLAGSGHQEHCAVDAAKCRDGQEDILGFPRLFAQSISPKAQMLGGEQKWQRSEQELMVG